MRPFTLVPPTLAALLLLGGCNTANRLANLGEQPAMSAISNPTTRPGYTPVSLPMPNTQMANRQPNSLWQSGTRAFFKDQRANNVGDLLTVLVALSDSASLDNVTARSRSGSETAAVSALGGFENKLTKLLPSGANSSKLVDTSSSSASNGEGKITRAETINLRVAAVISQVLPNGNLVIIGKQEVRVNYELRDLQVTGVIRPQDITSINTISYDQIAEARISYGGKGQTTDLQQPRYGQQLLDAILPF